MAQNVGPDGHPIPEKQGVVAAVMAPIKPKPNTGEAKTSAVGIALDADGNPLDQTDLLAQIEAEATK